MTINFTMMAWIMEGARRANSLHDEHKIYKVKIASQESSSPSEFTTNERIPELLQLPLDVDLNNGSGDIRRVFTLGNKEHEAL